MSDAEETRALIVELSEPFHPFIEGARPGKAELGPSCRT